jgi:hypothetical protein
MRKRIKLLGIVALITLIGFFNVSCSNDDDNDGRLHSDLIGTWVNTDPGVTVVITAATFYSSNTVYGEPFGGSIDEVSSTNFKGPIGYDRGFSISFMDTMSGRRSRWNGSLHYNGTRLWDGVIYHKR